MTATRNRAQGAAAPSWDLEHWPDHVYPHSRERALYLVRTYRDELVSAGALTRIGRELVIIGDRYSVWLQKRSAKVKGFIPGSRTREQPST